MLVEVSMKDKKKAERRYQEYLKKNEQEEGRTEEMIAKRNDSRKGICGRCSKRHPEFSSS